MMKLSAADSLPLVRREDGVLLVTGTRVPFDTIVLSFRDGHSAEEISQQYPTVSLAAIQQIIGYCYGHLAELDQYLNWLTEYRRELRVLSEALWPQEGIRDRLEARRRVQ